MATSLQGFDTRWATLSSEYSIGEEFYVKALQHDDANIAAHIGLADLLYHIRHDYPKVPLACSCRGYR